MGTKDLSTLGRAARHNMVVQAWCKDCDRSAQFMASDLSGMYGHGASYKALRFRCKQCGQTDLIVSLVLPPSSIKTSTIWVPQQVKFSGER